MKDCPFLSKADQDYLLKLHDKALQNRLLSVEERDSSVSAKYIDMVECYYELQQPTVNVANIIDEDFMSQEAGPSSDCLAALEDFSVSVVKVSGTSPYWLDKLAVKHIAISPSPVFTGQIQSPLGVIDQDICLDSGCTGEAIISEAFAKTIGATIEPSRVKRARLADNSAHMTLLGSTKVSFKFKGNAMNLNALVSVSGDDFLMGIPGMEKLGLVLDCKNKTIVFQNGVVEPYTTATMKQCECKNAQVKVRKCFLRTPKYMSVILPGENIELTTCTDIPDGEYALQANTNAKPASTVHSWLMPDIVTVTNNKTVIYNSSKEPKHVSGKDLVAELFLLADSSDVAADMITCSQLTAQPSSHHDIVVDPDNVLPADVRNRFTEINSLFSRVFQPDLPRYNGAFGRVQAVINVPDSLKRTSRLKSVPWYPRKLLNELQDKIDELTEKGSLARPQDIGVDVEVVSPSFLVPKKPASRGYRLVTSFGHLAGHVKNPAAPITSTDQVLKRLSSWPYLIVADI